MDMLIEQVRDTMGNVIVVEAGTNSLTTDRVTTEDKSNKMMMFLCGIIGLSMCNDQFLNRECHIKEKGPTDNHGSVLHAEYRSYQCSMSFIWW